MKSLVKIIFTFAALSAFWHTSMASNTTNSFITPDKQVEKLDSTVKLKITGMTCSGCARNVSTAVQKIEGVKDHSLEYPGDIALITFDGSKTSKSNIIEAVEKLGYKAEVIH